MKKELNFMPKNENFDCYRCIKSAKITFNVLFAVFALFLICILGSSSYYLISQHSAEAKMTQNANINSTYQVLKANTAFFTEKANALQQIKQTDFDPILYTQELKKALPSDFNETQIFIGNELNFTITGTASNQEYVNNLINQLKKNSIISSIESQDYDGQKIVITGTLNRI